MSVRVAGNLIHVEGNGSVSDAEPILAALHEDGSRTIDLSRANRLHSAVIQLLLALQPRIVGQPADAFYASQIVPLLDTSNS